MSSVHEMSRVDRELSLELIESPINPAFLHMSTPLKGYDPMFHLQNNGEALWQWCDIKRYYDILKKYSTMPPRFRFATIRSTSKTPITTGFDLGRYLEPRPRSQTSLMENNDA